MSSNGRVEMITKRASLALYSKGLVLDAFTRLKTFEKDNFTTLGTTNSLL